MNDYTRTISKIADFAKEFHREEQEATLLKLIRNEMASGRAEGFEYTDEDYALIDRIVDGEVSIDEAIKEIKENHYGAH